MRVTNLLSSAVKCLQLQGGFTPVTRGSAPRPPYRLALAIFLAFRFFFVQQTNPGDKYEIVLSHQVGWCELGIRLQTRAGKSRFLGFKFVKKPKIWKSSKVRFL